MSIDEREDIAKISKLVNSGEPESALNVFKMLRCDEMSYYQFCQFARLLNLSQLPTQRKLKLAIGGRANLEYFVEALTLLFKISGIDLITYTCAFNTIEIEVCEKSSGLYAFAPDIIWFFNTLYDFENEYDMERVAQTIQGQTEMLISRLRLETKAQIIINNIDLPGSRVFGNFETTHSTSTRSLLTEMNRRISQLADQAAIFDYEFLSSRYGKQKWFSKRFWLSGSYPFDQNAVPMVANTAKQMVLGILGMSKKMLIVDLDNTIWPGTVAEEPINLSIGDPRAGGHIDFQKYLLELKRKGVLLAAVSKNDPASVQNVFQNVDGMVLKESHFVSIKSSWNAKAESIKEISLELNLPVSSMVFIDDNFFECHLVANMLPEISVVQAPEDSTLLVETLDQFCYFDIFRLTAEDSRRTELYQENGRREKSKFAFQDEQEYLRNLHMKIEARDLSTANQARALQLINKSNQYNLNGAKISNSELEMIKNSDVKFLRCYSLSDKFGDSGMISVTAGEIFSDRMQIDIWAMSCRVLQRGVEKFVLQDIVDIAKENGCRFISGRFVETDRNKMAADHFKNLNFSFSNQEWRLDLQTFKPQNLIEKA